LNPDPSLIPNRIPNLIRSSEPPNPKSFPNLKLSSSYFEYNNM